MGRTKKLWKKVKAMNVQHTIKLGPINTESLVKDPKHLAFTLSRYKFVVKMMGTCKHIVEIGCGEGVGALMLLAETSAKITAIDFDKSQIEYAREHVLPYGKGRLSFKHRDIISECSARPRGDGLVCIDVIEHINFAEQNVFLNNCIGYLKRNGIAIFGTPNKNATRYASERSKVGHINLFDHKRFDHTLKEYFRHVFLFSMNDEMIHTGFSPLAHYLIALCIK